VLRVCADPNNLPFSNERGEGFENELASLVANDFGGSVAYTWWPQRRGSTRITLNAGVCDVIMGVPEDYDLALTTKPYYQSTYVFVTRADRQLRLSRFDDPRLRDLIIGIHVIGDDYANVPPGDALVARGIVRNVRGYSVLGDYGRPSPPARLIEAVAAGDVDAAVAWGPLAGFFAGRERETLVVTPAEPVLDVPMRFSISMAVRRDHHDLRERLNELLERRRADIDAVLERFHVPRVDRAMVAAR
jgi:mxaJ protein